MNIPRKLSVARRSALSAILDARYRSDADLSPQPVHFRLHPTNTCNCGNIKHDGSMNLPSSYSIFLL